MRVGYLDTSCLVAVAFGEPGGEDLARRLAGYDELISSNLLEAEFRSALAREGVEGADSYMEVVSWVLPHRPLSMEIDQVLRAGHPRGADLFHLAAALYLADTPWELDFLTLDERQGTTAAAMGFPTPLQ